MPKELFSLDNGFLPGIIKLGNKGELMIQPVVYVDGNGQEKIIMFASGNGTDWWLVGFTDQPFDVFSSQGNGAVVQGIDQMFTAFSRDGINFTGLLVIGGRNGAVFSEVLYFKFDDSGESSN